MKLVSVGAPILLSAIALATEVLAAPDSNTQDAISSVPFVRQATERVVSVIAPGRVSTFTVSPNGRHVAYLAYANGKPDYVDDEGEVGKIAVVVDGKKGTHYYDSDQIDKPISELIFSPDSRRLAYKAEYRGTTVYIDGLGEERYGYDNATKPENTEISGVGWLSFSPDSKSAIYVISYNNADGPAYVVTDGKRGEPYPRLAGPPIFSPDSKHFAFPVQTNRPHAVFMVVDGQPGNHYDKYDDRYTTFSPDSSKLAYIAGTGQPGDPQKPMESFVVVNGQEGKHYTEIGNYLMFSPDSQHLLYPAMIAKNKWAVVVDGKEREAHDVWAIFNPTFSPDGKRTAYTAWIKPDSAEWYVVIDGHEGKRYKTIHDYVHFSADSKHTAYSASDNSSCVVVVDGQEIKRHEFAYQITYSPIGAQLAYVATSGAKKFVVYEGSEGKTYDDIEDLVFSPDGKYLAYAAYNKQTQKWLVVVNGQEGKSYNFVMASKATEYDGQPDRRLDTGSLQFDSTGKLHYLAVKNNQIVVVEEQLSTPD